MKQIQLVKDPVSGFHSTYSWRINSLKYSRLNPTICIKCIAVTVTSHETERGPLDRELNDTRNLKTTVWRKFRILVLKQMVHLKNTGFEKLIKYFFK
jgi:hypothetical protein